MAALAALVLVPACQSYEPLLHTDDGEPLRETSPALYRVAVAPVEIKTASGAEPSPALQRLRATLQQDLIQALLVTNFVGFPAALVFGALGARFGARRGIYLALSVYLVATIAAAFITRESEFYLLAITIGLVQGGVQSLSRSFFARLRPGGQSAEFFGFYNMLGKFAAVLGPALTGVVALASGSQRVGILSIILLFLSGLFLLTRVRVPVAD